MPAYKRQHYVPQSYLKHFAIDDSIQAYNLMSKRIHSMNCREVCSRDYFYSHMQEGERAFSQMESEGNRIITDIINENSLSKLATQDYCILLYFLAFQYSRTLRGKQEAEQYYNGFSNYILRSFIEMNQENFEKEGVEKDFLEKCRVAVNGPIHAFAMKSIMERGPFLIRDLKPVIFLNKTGRDFIISDNPIVLYNSFFNNPAGHFLYPFNSTTGLQSPGLQIFWPLDTKHMLVLYDTEFYNFKLDSNELVEIHLNADLNALNSLQLFNCSDNIFFADLSQGEIIRDLHLKYEGQISNEYYSIETMNRTRSNGQDSEIIINYTKDIDYNFALSFMYFNPKAKAIDIARDLNIVDFLRQHFKEEDEQFDKLFYLGEFIVTEEADRILFLEKPAEDMLDLLKRHVSGDWGEVSKEEKLCNDNAVENGSRILSAYTLSTGKKILILTEAANKSGHRETTKILTPDEFD